MNTSAENSNAAELEWRAQRIRTAMVGADLDGVLAFAPAWRRENVRYLTNAGLESSAAFAYLPAAGAVTAFVSSYEDELAVRSGGFVTDIRQVTFPDIAAVVERLRADLRKGRLGVGGAEFVPAILWQQLQNLLPGVELVSASALMDQVRLVKSAWELAWLRKAGEICDKSWLAFQRACVPGAREFEIVAAVEAQLREMGADDNFMLIASGGSDVRGMTPPSDRKLEKGDLVRTELTPQFHGYWTQICRTLVLGPPSDKQCESFDLFQEAVAAGLAVARPGVTAHEIATAENDVFRKYGYGEYCTDEWTRVRGHCLGLHLDEVPIIEGVHTVLEKNAVLVVHPNTFTPLAGYFVLGDPIVITEKGAEKLLSTPCEMNVVPA